MLCTVASCSWSGGAPAAGHLRGAWPRRENRSCGIAYVELFERRVELLQLRRVAGKRLPGVSGCGACLLGFAKDFIGAYQPLAGG